MACAIEGTVNEANREVLAFDNTGAAGIVSIVVVFVANLDSEDSVFDAITMGCFDFSFNFTSAFAGLGSVFAIFTALTGFSVLAGLTALIGLVALVICLTGAATAFKVFVFKAGFATTLAAFEATVLGAGLANDLTAGLAAGFLTTLGGALVTVLVTALTGLTGFFATTLTATLATALVFALGTAFLTVFFAMVFISFYPASWLS